MSPTNWLQRAVKHIMSLLSRHIIFVGDFPHERHDWFDVFTPAELRRTDLGSKNERITLSRLLRENVTPNERFSHTNYLRVGGAFIPKS